MNTEIKVTEMNKAEQVKRAYYDAKWDYISSECCYRLAVASAHELGGIETYNSNDGNRSISFAPTRVFDFDDLSTAQITYGGVY